mgnify:CR=1 FL=1
MNFFQDKSVFGSTISGVADGSFVIWIDENAVIQHVSHLPVSLRTEFDDGQCLKSIFDPENLKKIESAVTRLFGGESLKIIEIDCFDDRFHLAITPEKSGKSFYGFQCVFTPVRLLGNQKPEIDHLPRGLFKQLINNPNVWIDVFRLDNLRNIVWNSGAEKTSGYSAALVQNERLTWGWLYPETDYRHKNWQKLSQNLSQNGFSETVTRIKCLDGREKVMGWTTQILQDNNNNPLAFMNIGYDLTRETSYRDALRNSEEEYRTLADNSPDLIARFDQKSRCTYTNAVAQFTPFGITRKLVGLTPSEALEDPSEARELENRINQTFRSRQIQSFEIQTEQNKTTHTHEVHLVPEISPQEIIRSVLLISRDITQRRKNEHRIRTAERFEAAGRVACEMTHNINNRLTVMNGKLEILKRRVANSPEALPIIEELLNVTADVSYEIRDKLTLGQSTSQIDVIDAVSIMNKIIDNIRETKSSGIQLDVLPFSDEALVSGVAHQLENALLNIILNGLDAMKGKGTLNLSLRKVHLFDSTTEISEWNLSSGEYVRIDIADTGSGIPESIQPKIFDPLFTTKPPEKGSGMGLATVYSIVNSMNGAIDFTSKEGLGTTFTMLLPCHKRLAHEPEEKPQETDVIETPDLHILWVDDNETVLEVAIEMVETFGLKATAAKSGDQAVTIFRSIHDQLDIVVLDVHMPGMDGWETLDALQKIKPDVKVIVCTGKGFSFEAENMMKQGACSLLLKPFTADDLMSLFVEVSNKEC